MDLQLENAMNGFHSREQKRELVSILLDSVYYLDLGQAERNKLLCFLSYLGSLQAVVDKKYKSGLATCRKAFVQFKTPDPQSAARVYPILYLNLGKAFLANGRKKDAVESFRKGLQYDRSNVEIKKEMKLLGLRKEPPIAVLSRSNLLNRIIGKMIHVKSEGSRAAADTS